MCSIRGVGDVKWLLNCLPCVTSAFCSASNINFLTQVLAMAKKIIKGPALGLLLLLLPNAKIILIKLQGSL